MLSARRYLALPCHISIDCRNGFKNPQALVVPCTGFNFLKKKGTCVRCLSLVLFPVVLLLEPFNLCLVLFELIHHFHLKEDLTQELQCGN